MREQVFTKTDTESFFAKTTQDTREPSPRLWFESIKGIENLRGLFVRLNFGGVFVIVRGAKKLISTLLISALVTAILPTHKVYGQQIPSPSNLSLFALTIVNGYDAIYYRNKPEYKFIWFPYNDPSAANTNEKEVWEYAIGGNSGPSLVFYTEKENSKTIIKEVSARPAPADVPTIVPVPNGSTPVYESHSPFNDPRMGGNKHYGTDTNPFWYYSLTNDTQLDIFLDDCVNRYDMSQNTRADLKLISQMALEHHSSVDLYDRGIGTDSAKQQAFETKVKECYNSLTKDNKSYLLPYTNEQNAKVFLEKLRMIKESLRSNNPGKNNVLSRIDLMFSDTVLSSRDKAMSIISADEDNKLFDRFYGRKNQYDHDAKTEDGIYYPGTMLTEKIATQRFLEALNIQTAAVNQGSSSFWTKVGESVLIVLGTIIGGAVGGAGAVAGAYLATTLTQDIEDGVGESQIDDILKKQVKAYFIANYIMRNNEFNECLGGYGVTNSRLAQAAKNSAENPTPASPNSNACNDPKRGSAVGKYIWEAICNLEFEIYSFIKGIYDEAVETLLTIIGLELRT